jgi:hypothetical protein
MFIYSPIETRTINNNKKNIKNVNKRSNLKRITNNEKKLIYNVK